MHRDVWRRFMETLKPRTPKPLLYPRQTPVPARASHHRARAERAPERAAGAVGQSNIGLCSTRVLGLGLIGFIGLIGFRVEGSGFRV